MTPQAARQFQDAFFRQNPSLRAPLELMRTVQQANFFVKDLQSRSVMGNAFCLVTYDLTREEGLVGRAARDFFPDLLAEAYEANDRKVLETGQSLRNEVWLVPHIRGTPRWFVSGKSPLFDFVGRVGGKRPLARECTVGVRQNEERAIVGTRTGSANAGTQECAPPDS